MKGLKYLFGICIVITLIGCSNKAEPIYKKDVINNLTSIFNCSCSEFVCDCRTDLCNPFEDYNDMYCSFGFFGRQHYSCLKTDYGCSSLSVRLFGFYLINESDCIKGQFYEIGKCPHNTTFIEVDGEEIEIC